MPAGPGQRRGIVLVIVLKILVIMPGTLVIQTIAFIQWAGKGQMTWVCMTCTAVLGNGARIGIATTQQERQPILKARHRGTTGFTGAAAGTLTPVTAGAPYASGARPAFGKTPSGSGL